jgi:hypothetical protein
MRKKCREIAERAGQPLDEDDYQSPAEYATKKFQEAQNALRTWRPHGEPGKDGNPPTFVLDVLKKLFATKFFKLLYFASSIFVRTRKQCLSRSICF